MDCPRSTLVSANHILANENVLDVFGHVSVRDPDQSDRYLLSRAISPATVTLSDIQAFNLESDPEDPSAPSSYAERVIHGEIYKARPDVHAVCHLHAADIMPFCVSGAQLYPISHVGATIGARVPMWSSRDEFGDTDLLVASAEQGASLAAALASNWTVLMKNHGGTVVGRSLHELVFRAVQLCRNADALLKAMTIGSPEALTDREIELAAARNLSKPILDRAWHHWMHRLES